MNRQSTAFQVGDDADRALKAAHRAMWALGDYDHFARATIWEMGPLLVETCAIGAGQRVLDLAAGSGNTALRVAAAGATVVAADLTPENFEAGRRAARELGVEVEWREADAEALPFADASFDAVVSSFGAIFAPHHQAVADEMVRVVRPGGTIGLVAFTPDGLAARLFEVFAPYAPPLPPGALPPVLWGSDRHLRELFGERVDFLTMETREYVERAATPQQYGELFRAAFGPTVAIHRGLAGRPDELARLESAFESFLERSNRGAPGGPAEYVYEYLLVIARRKP